MLDPPRLIVPRDGDIRRHLFCRDSRRKGPIRGADKVFKGHGATRIDPGAGGSPLAGFLVRSMRSTPPAVLLELHPLAGVRLVLGGHVIAPLTLLAGERDGWSFC